MTHANRGNVAVICWNTLNAATWYVDSEKLDGEVALGKDDKTLLAINFNDFVTEKGNLKEVEELKITKDDIKNDRQLIISADKIEAAEDGKDNFADEFAKQPSKNKDKKSYKTKVTTDNQEDEDVAVIYVPEEVCEDLDSLRNKTITIILGEDNVAALIVVEDDVVDTEFLTKYVVADNKITVGGEVYKLAKSYKVTINDADQSTNSLETVLKTIDSDMDLKNIEKKIEATLTLDEDDKVEAIELFTSIDGKFNTAEVLVTKVKETSKAYTIYTTGSNITWDIDDEDDKDFEFPKVYVDGTKADIRDIEAGNVLTIITDSDADSDVDYKGTLISKVYASTKAITGEATRVKKSNNAVTVDGTAYVATDMKTDNKVTTKELKDNKFEDSFDAKKILDNDEVTLYLNIFDEYVKVSLDKADTDYTFGVVTFVDSNFTRSGDEKEIQELSIRVLLADGKKAYYTLTLDTADEDLLDELGIENITELNELPAKGDFVMFEADSNNVIEIDDAEAIQILTAGKKGILDGDYVLATPTSVDKDDEEFVAAYGSEASETIDAEYDASSTVIFNTEEKEIVSKWKSIVETTTSGDSFKGTDTFAIFEDDDAETPLYIVVAIRDGSYADSEAEYAVVDKSAYKEGSKWYVDFTSEEGVDLGKDASASAVTALTDIDGALVEYKMSSSKVSKAAMLLDINEFEDLADEDEVKTGVVIKDGYETKLGINSVASYESTADNKTTIKINAVVPGKGKVYGDKIGEVYTLGSSATNNCYYAYRLEGIFNPSKTYTVVTANPTLLDAGHDTELKVQSFTDEEDFAIILKNGVTATMKVYEGNVEDTYPDKTPIATYEFKNVVVTEENANTEASTIASKIVKEHFTVEEVKEYKNYVKVTYKDFDDDYALDTLGSIKVDEDALIYDARNGELTTLTWSQFKTEVEEGVFAIPFVNNDCDSDAEVNVLVIVD